MDRYTFAVLLLGSILLQYAAATSKERHDSDAGQSLKHPARGRAPPNADGQGRFIPGGAEGRKKYMNELEMWHLRPKYRWSKDEILLDPTGEEVEPKVTRERLRSKLIESNTGVAGDSANTGAVGNSANLRGRAKNARQGQNQRPAAVRGRANSATAGARARNQ